MFGLPHDKELLPRLWWGARGIYHPSKFSHMEYIGKRVIGKRRRQKEVYTETWIDVPPDRYSWAETVSGDEHLEDRRRLIRFVNEKAMKAMLKQFKKCCPDPGSDDVFVFEADGYRFEGTPSGSYGHFYMGAWEIEEAVMSFPPSDQLNEGKQRTQKFVVRDPIPVTISV